MRDKNLCSAVRQAMRYEISLPFRTIAAITHTHPKNAWGHIYAKRGSNVRPWQKRSEEQKEMAILIAKKIYYSSLIL